MLTIDFGGAPQLKHFRITLLKSHLRDRFSLVWHLANISKFLFQVRNVLSKFVFSIVLDYRHQSAHLFVSNLSKRPSPVFLKENYDIDNFNLAASFQKIECLGRADEYYGKSDMISVLNIHLVFP